MLVPFAWVPQSTESRQRYSRREETCPSPDTRPDVAPAVLQRAALQTHAPAHRSHQALPCVPLKVPSLVGSEAQGIMWRQRQGEPRTLEKGEADILSVLYLGKDLEGKACADMGWGVAAAAERGGEGTWNSGQGVEAGHGCRPRWKQGPLCQ